MVGYPERGIVDGPSLETPQLAIKLVKATREMFPRIHAELLSDFNPAFGPERWERIFAWPWENPEDHVGYALVEGDGPVVGYAGLIFSRQEIGGRAETFCNITTWVVKDAHRSAAMMLIMPAILRRDLTLTNLTSIPEVNHIFSRLGFRVLETHLRVMFPQPWRMLGRRGAMRVRVGVDAIAPLLSPSQRTLMQDHTDLCEHFLIETGGGEYCYLMFTRGRRWRIPIARIHHISHPTVFARSLPIIQRELLKMGLPLLQSDARFVDGMDVPLSRQIPLAETRLFRSNTLQASEISNLYSEIVLLNI